MQVHMNLDQAYVPRVSKARSTWEAHSTPTTLLSRDLSQDRLMAFLIYFSARGVQITRPVSDWLIRSGERTKAQGFTDIGDTLLKHARHEAGHHEMMIHDANHLTTLWNRRHAISLDAGRLIGEPPTRAMREYIELHEKLVDSDYPYAQAAVGLEIERMSATFGIQFVQQCRKLLPKEAIGGLTFITDHSELDVGHTKLLERLVDRILAATPTAAEPLAVAGSTSLLLYLQFLTDCMTSADALLQECVVREGASA